MKSRLEFLIEQRERLFTCTLSSKQGSNCIAFSIHLINAKRLEGFPQLVSARKILFMCGFYYLMFMTVVLNCESNSIYH